MAGGTPSPAQADQLIIWPVSGRPTQAEPRVMPGDSATTSDISVAVFRGVAAGGGGGESGVGGSSGGGDGGVVPPEGSGAVLGVSPGDCKRGRRKLIMRRRVTQDKLHRKRKIIHYIVV